MDSEQRIIKKRALLSTLREINTIRRHENFIVKNLWRVVALGAILTLAIPAQGLGGFEYKGTSVLTLMEATYWEAALIIASLYTIFCFVGHIGWKIEDGLRLRELYAKKQRLMRELGITVVHGEPEEL